MCIRDRVLTAFPIVPLSGVVVITVGAVVSGVAPVVKVQVLFTARLLPARSFTPVVKVAVNSVLPASGLVGVKVAVFPA